MCRSFEGWRPERCDRIALVLQGGGALGAYQAGVYQALHEAGIEPDWVSGVSIGAINSAIIAGNPPAPAARPAADVLGDDHRSQDLALHAGRRHLPQGAQRHELLDDDACMGQPGFFAPQLPNPWLSFAGAQTRDELLRHRAAARDPAGARRFLDASTSADVRFAVGAVNVLTGNFTYFDNAHRSDRARARHGERRAAAGAAHGQDRHRPFLGRRHRLQHAAAAPARPGRPPQHAGLPGRPVQRARRAAARHPGRDGAGTRTSCIPRAPATTPTSTAASSWKTRLHRRRSPRSPRTALSDEERRLKEELSDLPEITILHIIYQQKAYEGHAKDYEFSGTSMREHWQSGYEDTRRTLKRKEWLTMPPARRRHRRPRRAPRRRLRGAGRRNNPIRLSGPPQAESEVQAVDDATTFPEGP